MSVNIPENIPVEISQDVLAGSRFFEKPVDQSVYADYTTVIPNLIDFATIRSKLGTGSRCLMHGCLCVCLYACMSMCVSLNLMTVGSVKICA
jgi:hypothetical protein